MFYVGHNAHFRLFPCYNPGTDIGGRTLAAPSHEFRLQLGNGYGASVQQDIAVGQYLYQGGIQRCFHNIFHLAAPAEAGIAGQKTIPFTEGKHGRIAETGIEALEVPAGRVHDQAVAAYFRKHILQGRVGRFIPEAGLYVTGEYHCPDIRRIGPVRAEHLQLPRGTEGHGLADEGSRAAGYVGRQEHLHVRTVGLGKFGAFGRDIARQSVDGYGTPVERHRPVGGDMDTGGSARLGRSGGFGRKAAKHHHPGHHGDGRTEAHECEPAPCELCHHGKSFFCE